MHRRGVLPRTLSLARPQTAALTGMNTRFLSTSTPASTRLALGKVAVVTGGSRGIGATIAKRLAAEGAKVAITFVQDAAAATAMVADIEAAGGEALALQADSGVRREVQEVFEATIKRWGQLDIIVNNAAIGGSPSLVEDDSEDNVDRVMAVNYKGTLWGMQAAAKMMKHGGSIVNISSIASTQCWPGTSAYAASKAAVEVLTKTAAKELGHKGIRVNAVAPGLIAKDSGSVAPQEAQDYMKSLTPLENRLGTSEEVANVVAFLASTQASWVSGQVIRVDGAF